MGGGRNTLFYVHNIHVHCTGIRDNMKKVCVKRECRKKKTYNMYYVMSTIC